MDLCGNPHKLGLGKDRPSRLIVQNLKMSLEERLAFFEELVESLDRQEISGPSLRPIYSHCSPVGVVSKKGTEKMRPIQRVPLRDVITNGTCCNALQSPP